VQQYRLIATSFDFPTAMTFVYSVVEGVFCAVFFATLLLQGSAFTLNDTTRKSKKKTKNKNKNKRKRKIDLILGEDSRVSTRRRTMDLQPEENIVPVAPLIEEPALCLDATIPKFSCSDDNVIRPDHSLMDYMTLFVKSADHGPIYILPRNGSTQVYIAKHLACQHTVRELQYVLDYLPRLSPPPREVRYYSPLEDHDDDYFVVLNREDTVLALTFGFPFGALRDYMASSISNDAIQVEWQTAKVNRGYAFTMCMPQRAGNGVPAPYLKAG
jgi:hypothetical protein